MKIVVDCNVLISAGLTNGACRQVIFKALKAHELVVSKLILAEYKAVAARPKFTKVKQTLFELIDIIENSASHIEDLELPNINIPDPKDLIYLRAAINAKAQYLVTGNIKDFPELKYGDANILSPNDFLLIS